jgi:IS30 family transposase
VSHETIYRSLFIQARGVLKKELLEYLRARPTVGRSGHVSTKPNGLGQIKSAVSITERPSSIEDRAVPGPAGAPLGRRSGWWVEKNATLQQLLNRLDRTLRPYQGIARTTKAVRAPVGPVPGGATYCKRVRWVS